MGLHICYELALPAETSRPGVPYLLGALRSQSERLTFDEITEIREFAGAEGRRTKLEITKCDFKF